MGDIVRDLPIIGWNGRREPVREVNVESERVSLRGEMDENTFFERG